MYSKLPLLLAHCVLPVLRSMLASANLCFRADLRAFARIFVDCATQIFVEIIFSSGDFIYSSGNFIYSSGLFYI